MGRNPVGLYLELTNLHPVSVIIEVEIDIGVTIVALVGVGSVGWSVVVGG